MNVFNPHAASHRAIEDRLGAIERDLAIIKTTLEHLDKQMVTHRELLVTAGAILAVNLAVVGAASAALYFAMSTLTSVVMRALPGAG